MMKIKTKINKRRYVKTGKLRLGFTLIEVTIAAALLAILAVGSYTVYTVQAAKARDGKRLADLNQFKIAFAGYYEDSGCYPDAELVEECDGSGLAPYIDRVPCDPINHGEYVYTYAREACNTYRLFTKLENESNEAIAAVGCEGGCGELYSQFNYYVASDNAVGLGSEVLANQPPTCGGSNPYCLANVCSSCCPGSSYRCSSDGDTCIFDTTCSGE